MHKEHTYSPRERVLRMIAEGHADRLPKGELCIDDSVVHQTLGCNQAGFDERYEFVRLFNLDIYTLSPLYPRVSQRLPEFADCSWSDLNKWTSQTSLFTFGIIDGAFEWGMRIFGMEKFFVLPKSSPLAFQEFITSVEKLNFKLIKQFADSGINGIILADDIAFNKGLLIRPVTLQEHFFPSMSRQVAEIGKYNLPAFYHSDGDYRKVINDIVASGFVGLHCIDRFAGLEMAEIRSLVGDKLCLWGHLDVKDAENGDDPALLPEVTASIHKIAAESRVIIGTNSGLFAGFNLQGLKNIYQSL